MWSGTVTEDPFETGRPEPRRYLAAWLPFLPTDRLHRQAGKAGSGGPGEAPLVAVEKIRGALALAAVDRNAMRLGLAAGLTLADARARIPDLAVAEADPDADARFLDRLAALCDRFTPLVAFDPPHGLVLDITGCAHLFGGETGLLAALETRIARIGLSMRCAVAGTPDAARAFARHGRSGLCPPGAEEGRARDLPVAALEAPTEVALALSRAGLKRLGDLADRSSTAIAARFGEALMRRLHRILGREDRRIVPLRPLPDCRVDRQFPEPLLDMRGLEAILSEMIGEAAMILEARGAGGRSFEASFFRSDGAVRRILVETGRPSRDAPAILRLYRERLDTLADPLDPGFGFDAIRLGVPVAEPLGPVQPGLDGRAVEDEAVADLVDRLVVRFGRERVVRFVAQDSHDPDREARAVPAARRATDQARTATAGLSAGTGKLRTPAKAGPLAWPRPEPGEPPARPLQVFDPPQPVETLAEVPDGPPLRFRWRRVLYEIARSEGPERIAREWWREGPGEQTRDYFRVEDAAGRRFWVFRQGLYGREDGEPRWFLHGLFA